MSAQRVGKRSLRPHSYDSDRTRSAAVKTYAVIIERGPRNYSAYVPDLPGCIATGRTLASVRRNIREAIEFHLDGLRHEGLPIPEPSSVAESVEIQAA